MSIPVSFEVLGPGMLIRRKQTLGTMSYGADLDDKDTWLRYFKDRLSGIDKDDMERACPWVLDFESIYVPSTKMLIERSEIFPFSRICPRCNITMGFGIGINPTTPDWLKRAIGPRGPCITHQDLKLDTVWKCHGCGHSEDLIK
jgi:hypothetical protein